jgi:hypothetical protein
MQPKFIRVGSIIVNLQNVVRVELDPFPDDEDGPAVVIEANLPGWLCAKPPNGDDAAPSRSRGRAQVYRQASPLKELETDVMPFAIWFFDDEALAVRDFFNGAAWVEKVG